MKRPPTSSNTASSERSWLQRKVPVRVKDLKVWTKELIRLGLVRKERLGSRLVPGERHFDFWRRAAA